MSVRNTKASYGSISRIFHWLTALLIFTTFPLGLIAERLPYDTAQALALKAQLFSVHKTLGVTVFFLALARILWALCETRPAPLHPERRFETFAAETVHWALYLSLVLVPLSGWVHHAAVAGFAPILWPFGQDLPLVPKSEALGAMATAVHWLFTKILLVTLGLHILGALKHVLIDRDATLARMLHGKASGSPKPSHTSRAPVFAATALYILAFGGALLLTRPDPVIAGGGAPLAQTAAQGNWQVESGTLAITVQQMGAAVTGTFANWSADIRFDETTMEGKNGSVTVQIDLTSLSLGSVTAQTQEPEFFDTATFPTARFTADIKPGGAGYQAIGTLSLRGVDQPVTLPFTLQIEGDQAKMQGKLSLDRRDFGMGASYPDEASVGFAVEVSIDLSAKRQD